MDTSLPLMLAGEISEMYIGDRLEARPMATPPIMRQDMNMAKVGDRALPADVTAKSRAARISRRFRPNLSLRTPAARAPARHPTRAQLFAQPTREGSFSLK